MRWTLILISLTTLGVAQDLPLDDARVVIPYKELRSLIDAARPAPAPAPESPVASAILSARYDLRFAEAAVAGTAEYQVQTFRDGPHVVPLAGDALVIESIEPKEAVVVLQDGQYALAVEGKQRVALKIRFTLAARSADGALLADCAVAPAVSASVSIQDLPDGHHVTVENGLPSPGAANKWNLRRSSVLRVALRDETNPTPPPVTMPAVVGEASGETRVAEDGVFFNKMTWKIRHQSATAWTLRIPEDRQMISASVNGTPASPTRLDAEFLEFRLPEAPAGGTSTVEMTFTGKGKPFDPAGGELDFALPATPLLVEKINWRLAVPEKFSSAVAGTNMKVEPAEAGTFSLTKEYCQGEAPEVRISYRLAPSITLPAVIREARAETRVVGDGSFANKIVWRIRHQDPVVWKLDLGKDLQVVSALVGGRAATPERLDDKTLVLRLPAPGPNGESEVALTYTGKTKAFDPVRGELALALPATPLLIESLQWRVAIPSAYTTVAAQGNVEFLPSKNAGEILVGKDLCQGEEPGLRLFYQKPETTKP